MVPVTMPRFAKLTLLVMVLLGVGAGCSGGGDRAASPSQAVAQDPGVVHVHGLGINPKDGALFAATHTGLFVVGAGTDTRVTERLQDTMGFTVVGPDHFLGSGHPDFRDPSCTTRTSGRCWG
jgi:hypothetical protein